ncbi:MAG: 7-carboxy-7-deazaguanine synthase QueE [Hydrogenothermaceae bacterium]|nr:7-carboxy-7-deazaguanine synthase QueE [Hydrogenothermaceae bacterium]
MRLLKKELYKVKVVEIFRSVEGEGKWVGLPVVFVRLEGCNLRCSWCDTAYSYDGKSYRELSVDEVLEEVSNFNVRRVCITGGEPFFSKNLHILVERLVEDGYTVFIQTNGTLWNDNFSSLNWGKIYIICSPKPPFYFVHKNLIPYIRELKFVVDENLDLSHIFKDDYRDILKTDVVILQPESNRKEMVQKALGLQDKLLRFGVESRIIPQCHKLMNLP